MNTASQILDHDNIVLKLERMAWEILEHNHTVKEIVLLGIENRGVSIAELLTNSIQQKSKVSVTLGSISLDKEYPLSKPITVSLDSKVLTKKSIVLIDDVLNSGKTMSAAFAEVLKHKPQKVSIAVLADRDHKRFPLSAEIVGIRLATTLKEHISFEENKGKMRVILK